MGDERFFSAASAVKDEVPRHAATIVLVRPAGDGGLQTFLVKRHGKSAFMGGAHVFPGGKLDAEDTDEMLLARLPRGALERAAERLEPTPGIDLDARTAAGLYVAACRETFEEAGVLLARRRHESACVDLSSADDAARFSDWRRKLAANEARFVDLLAAEKLELAVDRLVYWAHWITPSAEKRRYDTRFFVALMPDGQRPVRDDHETTDAAWMTPSEALADHRSAKIFLPPPTEHTLDELAAVGGFAEVEAEGAHRVVAPVLPKLTVVDGDIAILLPWDPLYLATDGESLPNLEPHPMMVGRSRILVKPPG